MRFDAARAAQLKTETTTTRAPAHMAIVNGPLRKAALSTVVSTIEPVVAMVFMIESVCHHNQPSPRTHAHALT
jgi:hypothetical protein